MPGLLRFTTAGSVDDGKSTLIGRLLHDSKSIYADQMAAIELASTRRGLESTNLALLTDGLRAEREQGITIDVAYRYFSTPRRSFIIADTPGHVQYTRNMVTGASTADLAVVLVDARRGPLEQSRRHAFLSSLLGVRHLVVAVNKMDLVGWNQATFRAVEEQFGAFAARLDIADVTYLPISALHGDNVVERSSQSPWYIGPSLLEHLETVDVADDRDGQPARFPVQWVVLPADGSRHEDRGYAGRVAGGRLTVGDEVVVLPSGNRTRVGSIRTLDGALDSAAAGRSVTVHLEDDVDVSRGDLLCAVTAPATVSQDVDAVVCWMDDRPLTVGARYAIRHNTRSARAVVRDLDHRLDVNTLLAASADRLDLNDIGRVRLRTTSPLAADPYRANRATGSFILIDEATNATAGAGMIVSSG
jgi:bifunctional enzyme CysN/CysC